MIIELAESIQQCHVTRKKYLRLTRVRQFATSQFGVPGKFCTSGSETNWYGRSIEWRSPGSTHLSRL